MSGAPTIVPVLGVRPMIGFAFILPVVAGSRRGPEYLSWGEGCQPLRVVEPKSPQKGYEGFVICASQTPRPPFGAPQMLLLCVLREVALRADQGAKTGPPSFLPLSLLNPPPFPASNRALT